jgi:negative regulator of sigma-B (phosphoserine phosphatase)
MNPCFVEWGVAGRQMQGETLSGDLHLVKQGENEVLIAVADGLGHGQPAAEAATLALRTVDEHSDEPLVSILEHCSRRLRSTRGVVMSVALLDVVEDSMEWLGVGNVAGVLVHSGTDGNRLQESLLPSQGVVGIQLPPLRARVVKIAPGDTIVLATDGIRPGFEDELVLFDQAEKTAQTILSRDGLETDDALVVVATYQGRPR